MDEALKLDTYLPQSLVVFHGVCKLVPACTAPSRLYGGLHRSGRGTIKARVRQGVGDCSDQGAVRATMVLRSQAKNLPA